MNAQIGPGCSTSRRALRKLTTRISLTRAPAFIRTTLVEPRQLRPQRRHLFAQLGDGVLQGREPIVVRGRLRVGGRPLLAVAAEQLRVTLLLLAGTAREPHRELALCEARKRLLELTAVTEPPEPLGPRLQLARRLRPAQHQHREHGDLGLPKAERLVEEMAELDGAAAPPAREPRPAAARQAVERRADRRLVVLDDRVAVGRLVAREPERVQRQRVDVRGRALLLDQAAEDADLDSVGVHAPSLRAQPKTISSPEWLGLGSGTRN